MMFFDGDPRRRRNVNLGGASAGKSTRKEVLTETRAARAQRELEHRQQRAARKIQAFYRGRSTVRRLRRELRAEWDAIFARARSAGRAPAPEELLALVRGLNFLGLEDVRGPKRLAEFSDWLMEILACGFPRHGDASPGRHANTGLRQPART